MQASIDSSVSAGTFLSEDYLASFAPLPLADDCDSIELGPCSEERAAIYLTSAGAEEPEAVSILPYRPALSLPVCIASIQRARRRVALRDAIAAEYKRRSSSVPLEIWAAITGMDCEELETELGELMASR